jgi:hypothetical protein
MESGGERESAYVNSHRELETGGVPGNPFSYGCAGKWMYPVPFLLLRSRVTFLGIFA